jgi:predicted DsbA family dithiol-disulfide isomerase
MTGWRDDAQAVGMARRIEVWADRVCPFCWLAEPVLDRLRQRDDVQVERRAFELRPAPAPLPAVDEPYMVDGWTRIVEPLARSLGIEPGPLPTVRTRTRKAHEAAAFARVHGAGDAMAAALYAAYFGQDRDIGRIDVLVDIGHGVGLDRSALKVALDIDQYTDAVAADQEEARRRGLQGVPAVVRADGEALIGWRPYEEVRRWLHAEGGGE